MPTLLRSSFIRLAFALAACLLGSTVHAGGTLRVLAWPGYADPDIVKAFEQRTGAKVEVSYIDTDEALWARIAKNHGGDFDVFAVNTAELQRYIQQALVVPINPGAITNTRRQLPQFQALQKIPGIVHGGKVFAMPYTYSEMGLIYDRRQVKTPPTSIQALWDPRYQGKVLVYNGGAHNFALAAQAMGSRTPFALQASQWESAVQQLIALRRNALTFYSQLDDSVNWFQSNKAALLFANYGSQQFKQLQAAGLDVGYAIPQEGALAWLDCWVITRGAKDTALAEAWINYTLEDGPGKVLQDRQGLANTTAPSPYLGPQDKLIWLEPVEDVDRRNRLWNRIVSGDRASKVLAP
ncbi:MAG: spermidine/putrescine ABC transporter substrate-binding protein [Curvibacter sp. RIFCSPHIGHO2_12_FULL_63_18]|nr:MAG: spermidine/putrescine ABC transporter substrate-binding protein [Curvibacter sp. GWA2_63_95]OGP07056.1 MAG: spermidine/putrescine ABC transporter substrate-binding protein [Curvibacter sp. RIFCSPHIGHO2_12_FULL_63_18]